MRKNSVVRNTKETKISCSINLDGIGKTKISTGIGFFDHMLEIFSHHSLIDLNLIAEGDTHVDLHHTVEDCGYSIGKALNKALAEKKGINSYGFFYVPMDECLSRCVIDFCGRPEIQIPSAEGTLHKLFKLSKISQMPLPIVIYVP